MYYYQTGFTEVFGGYPQAANGSLTAIISDGGQFYLDVGKNAAYANLTVSNILNFPSSTFGYEVTGIEIVIVDAGTSCIIDSEFSTRIYHHGESAFTSTITTTVPAGTNPSSTNILVGGPTELWGKTWTFGMINDDFRVNLFDPVEPTPAIALMADYIYVKVYYKLTNSISFSSGKISMISGNITI